MDIRNDITNSFIFTSLPLIPEVGLYLTIIMLPLMPFRYVAFLFGLTVFSFLVKIIIEKDFSLKRIPIKYSICLFLLPLFFSGITSIAAEQGIVRLIVYIIAFMFLFISINLIDSKEKFYYLIISLVIAASIVGLYGIYQYKTGIQLNESWIDTNLNPHIQTRVISTFDNPNILAEYLLLTIPITFALFYNSNGLVKKLLYLTGGALQVFCILFTYSRGGWIGLLLAMLIFAVFIDRKLLILYAIGGIGVLALNPQGIITRVSTIISMEDTSNLYRISLWKATINMIKDFWLNGVGLGMDAYKSVHQHYMIQGAAAAHSHNLYLQIFVESGIFGIIGFLVLVFNSLRMNLTILVKGMEIKTKRIALAAFASIVGVLIHGLVDYIFFSEKIIFMFWIIISIGLIGYNLEFNNEK